MRAGALLDACAEALALLGQPRPALPERSAIRIPPQVKARGGCQGCPQVRGCTRSLRGCRHVRGEHGGHQGDAA